MQSKSFFFKAVDLFERQLQNLIVARFHFGGCGLQKECHYIAHTDMLHMCPSTIRKIHEKQQVVNDTRSFAGDVDNFTKIKFQQVLFG